MNHALLTCLITPLQATTKLLLEEQEVTASETPLEVVSNCHIVWPFPPQHIDVFPAPRCLLYSFWENWPICISRFLEPGTQGRQSTITILAVK